MSVLHVFLFCNFSSQYTRSHLLLSNLKFDNFIRRFCGKEELRYFDVAPWIEAFINFFKVETNYHLHVVAIQMGMKKDVESFDDNGVSYHYIKGGIGIVNKILDSLFNIHKRNDYPLYWRRLKKVLNETTPDILILCGAENPDYASSFLRVKCQHKLVIMQTLMNDEKRIKMGVSSPFRRGMENRIIKHCHCFAIPDNSWVSYVRMLQPDALCFPFTFPTIKPKGKERINKQYTFVFFAGLLGKNKGTNDVVLAMSKLCAKHPNATLNIIGSADETYMKHIHNLVEDNNLSKNIVFTPPFPKRDDLFDEVCKSSIAVLPGITASLNSTVRESMLLGIPTITYETVDTLMINKKKQSLLTAQMEDVDDLASKLEFSISHFDQMCIIGKNGKEYADEHFSQDAFDKNFVNILKSVYN